MPLILSRLCISILTLVCALLLAGCSTPGTYMGTADVNKPVENRGQLFYPHFVRLSPDICVENSIVSEYRVGPQDILTIIVWNHPELTIPSMQTTSENVNIYTQTNQQNNNPAGILVSQNGEIFFSLAGRINVNGMTVDDIREELTQRLDKYIRKPQVSVRVASFRNKPIYIVGEVEHSGVQYITDLPVSILDIINNAGGIDKESSDTHYVYVMRGNILHPTVYWLDMSSPGAMLMAVQFKLKPRDIVVVSTASVARYSRVINKILPTIQTFTIAPFQSTIVKDD
jgi:protein involved in polysaccharide export with SLBB domain